jgi:glycosyltransferase involved in cell wall biosynthesis
MSQSGAQITSPSFAKPAEGGRPVKILAFGDSPTRMTGFGRVMRNVLQRWWETAVETTAEPAGGTPALHCWGIGYEGWPHDLPCRIFPGGTHDWNSAPRLSQFLKVLADGQYTQVFMLMDPDALSVHGFPQKLRQMCKARGIRVLLYYPVDAPLEPEWLGILDAADVAVSYTEYGREATRRAMGKSQYPIEVVPHGVDECFAPMSVEDRAKARVIEFELETPAADKNVRAPRRRFNFVEDDTFLMLGVNKNEWRKDPLRMLEILVGLRRLDVPAKLLLRMDPMSAMGGVHLELAAKQLGLTYGKEWCHIGPVADELLAGLYNAADLYLTTSLGEGWGLGVTEAMACHTPVAMPRHTSLAEIGEALGEGTQGASGEAPDAAREARALPGVIWLPMETGFVCGADTRLRRRVGLQGAIQRIYEARDHGRCGNGVRNALAPGLPNNPHPPCGHLLPLPWAKELRAEDLWPL